MHVVAIASLATPPGVTDAIAAEAKALANDLGTTAYEERLKLVAGLPAIVLTAADPARARGLLESIRARGHEAFCVDAAEVVGSAEMVLVRRFAFEPDALVLVDSGERLPFGDLRAILRAMHSKHTESRTEVTTKKFDVGRAVLSGGLVVRKKVTEEKKAFSSESEQVLYLFRASGEAPWLVRERGTNYTGLGAELEPSAARNFLSLTARLRELAPAAGYSERLLAPGSANKHMRLSGGGTNSVSVSSADGVDLLAHILALSMSGAR
ncbi:MAG TPA: hypothetical protein VGM56_08535 [Byssovorax sp.]